MRIDHLVFGAGDLVTGWGRLRGTEGGVWFDPGGWYAGGEQPMSRDSVRLQGADLSAVATEYGPDGSIPGWATILPGVWTRPPCPAPAGGWPTGRNGDETEDLTFDLGDLQDTGAAVSVAVCNRAIGGSPPTAASREPVVGPRPARDHAAGRARRHRRR